MPTPFPHSRRMLETDGFGRSLWSLLCVTVLLGAGLAWFLLARVELYETTGQARLEAEAAAHPITPPVAGRVVTTRLVLGQRVQAGDVLIELDDAGERLRRDE